MITKETFYAAMHKALKTRKMPKKEREKFIEYKWHLIDAHEHNNADEVIEVEEQLTREFIKQSRVIIPSESSEQIEVIKWFRSAFEHAIIYANANGGHRDIRTAVTLKAEGVLAGVSDCTILWCDGRTTWLEMKRKKGGVQSDAQKHFERFVTARGDNYILALGFEDAKRQILEFLEKIQ
jgi:hypothetical protein